MQLLSIEPSTATVLGAATAFRGQLFTPPILARVVDRYDFQYVLPIEDAIKDSKFEFRTGNFRGFSLQLLQVFSDGIVVTAAMDSDLIDAFFEDLLGFMKESYDVELRKVNSVDRSYLSVLIVQSDKDLLAPLEKVIDFGKRIQRTVADQMGVDAEFRPTGFTMSVEEATIATMKPAAFKLERRAALEFKFNTYFSAAPMRTKDHLALLEDWERSI